MAAVTAVPCETDLRIKKIQKPRPKCGDYYRWDVIWINFFSVLYMHVASLYGLYLFFFDCSWKTIVWCLYLSVIGSLGSSAGAHRYWTHKSYKANLPLRILLAYFQSTCYQGHVWDWVRNHRMHHKYTDTDADPYNSLRGVFFSQFGWVILAGHEDFNRKARTLYLKDIEADPVVRYQKRYAIVILPFFCLILPALVPWYFFGESLATSWYVASILRYTVSINGTMTINSYAHLFGKRPYDNTILPTQNRFVNFVTLGEGGHNFHHAFPIDYRSSEFFGDNFATCFIDFCAKLGWATDLKTVTPEMVEERRRRTGDKVEGMRKKLPEDQEVDLCPKIGWEMDLKAVTPEMVEECRGGTGDKGKRRVPEAQVRI